MGDQRWKSRGKDEEGGADVGWVERARQRTWQRAGTRFCCCCAVLQLCCDVVYVVCGCVCMRCRCR